MSQLTNVDSSYIKFIVQYYKENRFYPSYDEIKDGLGVKSKRTVFSHMQKLEDNGVIVRKAPCSPIYRILNMEMMLKEGGIHE